MEKNNFNQKEYIKSWKKENMKQVKVTFKKEFVDQFKEACKKLDMTQSDVFRNAMQEVIDKVNEK